MVRHTIDIRKKTEQSLYQLNNKRKEIDPKMGYVCEYTTDDKKVNVIQFHPENETVDKDDYDY